MATNLLRLARTMGVIQATDTVPLHLYHQDRLYRLTEVEPADMATVTPMLQRQILMPEVMEHPHLMVSLIPFIFTVKNKELTSSQLQAAMVSVPTYHHRLRLTHTLPHHQLMADHLAEDMVMVLLRQGAAVTILMPPGGRRIEEE